MNINPKYLKALLRIAAKQDIRYYLNGILIECSPEGGKFYVATDGHRLGVFHEGWGTDAPQTERIIIPREVVEILRLAPNGYDGKKVPATLEKSGERKWTLDPRSEAALTFTPIDGNYPDWRKVLPKTVSGEAGDYNYEYLRDFNLIATEFLDARWGCIMWQNGKEAAVITAGSADFIGLLQPMRHGKSDGSTLELPAWYAPPAPVAAAEPATAEAVPSP